MIRRSFRVGLLLGILGGLGFALFKVLQGRRENAVPEPAEGAWPPIAATGAETRQAAAPPAASAPPPAPPPEPPLESRRPAAAPAKKAPAREAAATKAAAKKGPARKAAKRAAPAAAWVEPSGDTCPRTHPVKAKLTSKIFHLPGMLNYDRTKPDRCYRDADAAEADGLRKSKR